MEPTNEFPTLRDYQDSIDVQNAVNLSGVVHSFARVMPKIMAEMRENKGSSEYVWHHPISVLYSSKIASLTNSEDASAFSKAYNTVMERIEIKTPDKKGDETE